MVEEGIMSVTAILQARTSSKRLPNKVLLPILGKPMLELQLERTLKATQIDTLVVATSNQASDDFILQLCKKLNIKCFRGSLNDVLERFYQAAQCYAGEHVVRMTADCPVIDPKVIDEVIKLHIKSGADYSSNTQPPSFPDGLDVEVMRFSALKEAWQNAKLPSQREHVTPYIVQHKGFKKANLQAPTDLSAYRLTVDEQADFDLISFIYQQLYHQDPCFNYQTILQLLKDNPSKQQLNRDIQRNAGYAQSLQQDALAQNSIRST